MDVVYARCCGLDVHKKTVAACLIPPGPRGPARKEVRTFGTMTDDLPGLGDWLAGAGCTHVALESTGVYWKPIWNLLEGPVELPLVNARHIKAVPGRKTDVRDSEWLADLLRHGRLRASFVPDREQRELRESTRYRASLVRERTREINRLQKTLAGANIKLAAVATDILGRSGHDILVELAAGATDAAALANPARGKLRAKIPERERALVGRFGAHRRFLVARHLGHIDDLDEVIGELSAQIAERLRPFDEELERLDAITGVGRYTAEVIVAEIGTDLARFPTARHLAAWAGLCPGDHESAGKRRSGKTRKGNRWLRTALIEAATGAGRSRATHPSARYHRLAARRGKKKAAGAGAHSILVDAYRLLEHGTTFRDLGGDFFDRRNRDALERRLVSRLEALGNKVNLEKVEQVASTGAFHTRDGDAGRWQLDVRLLLRVKWWYSGGVVPRPLVDDVGRRPNPDILAAEHQMSYVGDRAVAVLEVRAVQEPLGALDGDLLDAGEHRLRRAAVLRHGVRLDLRRHARHRVDLHPAALHAALITATVERRTCRGVLPF